MLAHFGPSGWWPADSPFEIAVGAVLTQNTSWRNVEKAIAGLRERGFLRPEALYSMPLRDLEDLLRPAGFFRLKAGRLRALLEYFSTYAGWDVPPDNLRLDFLRGREGRELREELLGVRGIGPETADCLLLYALNLPFFVIDAYTLRLCRRHGLLPPDVPYEEAQEFFMDRLEADAALYNEFHALIVRTGHNFCKKNKPLCSQCPLGVFLDYAVD
ncbi:MAG: endonuclease III domain-containing protein [Desulfovibrio sp.]|nr:endonuclease III domain-containing protein [Desulfovibrio sp.]